MNQQGWRGKEEEEQRKRGRERGKVTRKGEKDGVRKNEAEGGIR